ncbi:hypothetical protein GCM10027286_16990 [Virgibacillus ainsalahensis]
MLFPQESAYSAYAGSGVLVIERIKLMESIIHGGFLTQIESYSKLLKKCETPTGKGKAEDPAVSELKNIG